MKREHRHRAVVNKDYGYTKCIAPHCCNPAAHGAVCVVSICRCGFIKEVNRNGGRIEAGSWHEPRPGDYVGILK